jgi:hypothetical protein
MFRGQNKLQNGLHQQRIQVATMMHLPMVPIMTQLSIYPTSAVRTMQHSNLLKERCHSLLWSPLKKHRLQSHQLPVLFLPLWVDKPHSLAILSPQRLAHHATTIVPLECLDYLQRLRLSSNLPLYAC